MIIEDSASSRPMSMTKSVNSASFEEDLPPRRRFGCCFFLTLFVMCLTSYILGGCTLFAVNHIVTPNKSRSNDSVYVWYAAWTQNITYKLHLLTGRPVNQIEGMSPLNPAEEPNSVLFRILKELNVVPESYGLTVKLYLPGYEAIFPKQKELKFDGIVVIHMVAGQPTDTIELNAENLIISQNESVAMQGLKHGIKMAKIEMLTKLKKVRITLSEKVAAGKFQIKLVYEGLISSGLGGLYQSKYTNSIGEKKITAVTQMEPNDARKFVPCFDEPEYKATWDVTIIHPKKTEAQANGVKISSNDEEDGFRSTTFKQTPRMSSYLLAIFVSDFKFKEGKFSTNKTLRIWSRPESVEETDYALEAGIKSLECYEKLYNISFPLAKQDMIALPDFSFGAMENWGLVTYREGSLLYNNRTYSMERKRSIALVIAHELAHQWFGNLVTMKWWDDLWLNEGFATYMQLKGMEAINKDYLTDDYVLTSALATALAGDSQASSHPLSSKIETEKEISESFDGISYQKGGSVIRMIAKVMGEENFNKGIQTYLRKFQYRSTVALDLWTSLDEYKDKNATGPNGKPLNVTDFALQWSSQMGYPVVMLVGNNNTKLTISAERFKKNKNATEAAKYANPEYGFKWDVPLWYEVEGEGERFVWLPRGEKIKLPATDKAVIINSETKAVVRTNYCHYQWKKNIAALKRNKDSFSARTRYTVISDAFEMASVDKLPYELLFDLISYAEKETHYLPMSAVMNGLSNLGGFFAGSEEARVYRNYLKKIITPLYKNVSLEEIVRSDGKESEMHKNMQDRLIFFKYCATKDADCIAKVDSLFQSEVMAKCTQPDDVASQCSTVSASMRGHVYCMAVANGGQDVFNKILDLYKRETDPAETSALMSALTCSRDIPTLRFLLESIINNSGLFRFQDATGYIYSGVASNEFGRELILNHMISKWQQLYETFNSHTSFVSSIISASTSYIRSEQELQQLKDFVKSTPEAAKFHEFTKVTEAAEHRLNWIKKNLKKVTKIMEDRL